MNIYIASSWKNEIDVRRLAAIFRDNGHEVDAFCETSRGRFVFSFTDVPDVESHNGITMLQEPIVQKAFSEDKKWIDWADAIVMFLPCGRSAHLEAGYAKGTGKKLYILGEFPDGEFDVMYGFADGLYELGDFGDLLNDLKD